MASNPLATFKQLVFDAAPVDFEQDDKRVVVGDAPGGMPDPWAQIRGAGGPQPDKQCPENYRRVDLNVYSKDQFEADALSQQIDNFLRKVRHGVVSVPKIMPIYQTDVISIDAEGGPFQLVDTDRRVPFVFRSYVMFYGEDL